MSDALHVVCPHCHATNRVMADRLASAPTCGSCKGRLFTAHPVALDDQSFETHVGRTQIPVLVDFWAGWCGPCRMMAPAYEQAAALLEPRMRVAKVDTESAREVARQHRISSIPTLILFVDGREVARQSGALTSPSQIEQWAKQHVGQRA